MSRGVTLFLAFALTSCGHRDTAACLARCARFDSLASECQTFCTRSCAELRESFAVSDEVCRELQVGGRMSATPTASAHGPAPASPAPVSPAPRAVASGDDPTSRCAAFVAFAFGCGIGRPEPDPTLDLAVQTQNELTVRSEITMRCERRLPPFDEALIRCYQASAPDFARYSACADGAVRARSHAP